MSDPHAQFDTRHFTVYVGAWWRRWALGMMASVGEDGGGTIALLFGPLYLGFGVGL